MLRPVLLRSPTPGHRSNIFAIFCGIFLFAGWVRRNTPSEKENGSVAADQPPFHAVAASPFTDGRMQTGCKGLLLLVDLKSTNNGEMGGKSPVHHHQPSPEAGPRVVCADGRFDINWPRGRGLVPVVAIVHCLCAWQLRLRFHFYFYLEVIYLSFFTLKLST